MFMKERFVDMRILCLLTDAFGGRGGIAQYNRDFLTALSGLEGVQEVVVMPRCVLEKKFNLPAKINQMQPSFHPVYYSLRAAWTALSKGPFDLIYCGHLRMTILAWVISKLIKTPYLLQIFGIEAWQNSRSLPPFFVQKAGLVISISRFTKKKFQQWVHLEPQKVKILPPFVDAQRFQPGPKPQNLVKEWGLEGCQVMLTISRLDASERYKGHSLIINTMPALLKKNKNLRYVIAGSGSDEFFLKNLAKENNVDGQVLFIGQIDEMLKAELYRLSDVFIMPSKKEGFGIVFLEALASGVPVIAGNKDGSLDPLRDGEYGCLVDCDDRSEIQSAIEHCLTGATGRVKKATEFSFENFKSHLAKLIEHDYRL